MLWKAAARRVVGLASLVWVRHATCPSGRTSTAPSGAMPYRLGHAPVLSMSGLDQVAPEGYAETLCDLATGNTPCPARGCGE
jgi:hypothetical protein